MSPLFDAHFHVVEPGFSLVPNQGFVPDPFPCAEYLRYARRLGIAGGAVVAGSFQGFDRTWLVAALENLGPAFVGVAQLPADVTDAEILDLDARGVRAVRFNLNRGGTAHDLDRLARRVHDLAGWHVELHADASDLGELEATLAGLPRVVIDHLGLSSAGLPRLLRLVGRGVAVKATGFGRLDFDPRDALRRIAAVDPGALLLGTDLPSTRAPRPFADADVDLLREVLDDELFTRATRANALALYRPRAVDNRPGRE